MSTASCIYVGTIHHRRAEPRRSFTHRIALFYLDLEELPGLLGGRLVARRPGALRFRRRDYLGADGAPLDGAVRRTVQAATGRRPEGPVRLLTQLRSFGHCFNPVSFYYCLEPSGGRVDAVVAEVTNTPWGERHAYVIPGGSGDVSKALHVSPFMAMDHRYTVRAGVPGERLAIQIESLRGGAPAFGAGLALRRCELTRGAAARLAVRYPFANLRVLALIYGHAARLKLAGAPLHRHPARGSA